MKEVPLRAYCTATIAQEIENSMKNAKPNPVDENGEWEGCGVSEQRAIDSCKKMATRERLGDAERVHELVQGIPEPTDRQIAVGDAALDAYYDNTKDASSKGAIALVYRAMKALERSEPTSSIDYQQQRGRAWDIIDDALSAYQGFMLDDDYDAQSTLDKIMEKMHARRLVAFQKASRDG